MCDLLSWQLTLIITTIIIIVGIVKCIKIKYNFLDDKLRFKRDKFESLHPLVED